MRSVRLTISGRVQGVGYRDWARGQAVALGLAGWVRNRRDGCVEALVAGPADRIETFVAAVREGPSLARVDDIALAKSEAESLVGFEVRPTA